ncbi:MAG: DUF4405 domain-containing protein [Candidatus Aminicenantes bacterium]|nr:DUF4405 domain-containing protein [Candidatus Aminicenantes bacterium]
MRKKKFAFRAFTSLTIFLSFLFDAASGLILYVIPSGSEARWNNWRFLGLSKDGWVSIHTIFSFLLLIFAIIHICKNWKTILVYMRRGVKKVVAVGREFLLAATLVLLIFAGTVLKVPPLPTFTELGGQIQKIFWPGSEFESLDSHPERLTFDDFFEKAGVPRELALQRLKNRGVVLHDTKITLAEFTQKSGLSPADVYAMIVLR